MGLNISILNSRQGIRPSLSEYWIQNTIEAVKFIKKNNYTLISSIGMPTWELVTSLGSQYQIPMIIYLPIRYNRSITKSIELARYNFDLHYNDIQYIPLLDKTKNSTVRTDRDIEIISNADYLIPISIREKGNLSKLLQSIPPNRIIDTYKCNYKKSFTTYAYTIKPESITPAIRRLSNDYYYHWTKTTYGKMESEKSIDYYSAILNSHSYPRTAFDNLKNILDMKTISASSKNIRSQTKVVAFTECHPSEMYRLFKWRSRFHQMSFEPYAIAFKIEVIKNTLHNVKYYNDHSELDTSLPRWQTQSHGKISDWTMEKELRHKSDFHFQNIKTTDILLITRYKKEADELQKLTGIKTISYTRE